MPHPLYLLLQEIPPGKVATYGQLAEKLGNRKLARVVGNLLHRNPDGSLFPCYKVVSGKGRLSAAYAFGGIQEQKRRLEAEGIEVVGGTVDLDRFLWEADS